MLWTFLIFSSSISNVSKARHHTSLRGGTLSVGDTVGPFLQTTPRTTCSPGEIAGQDYAVGDQMKLGDLNGKTNGGSFYVTMIKMSATWCGPCQNYQQGPAACVAYEDEWKGVNIKIMTNLLDLNQPYSCSEWAAFAGKNAGGCEAGQIVSSEGLDQEFVWFDALNTDDAYPSTVLIDHTMKVYAMANSYGTYSIRIRLREMLAACGVDCCKVRGDTTGDEVVNVLDVLQTVNYILYPLKLIGIEPTQRERLCTDLNSDQTINVLDISAMVQIVLKA